MVVYTYRGERIRLIGGVESVAEDILEWFREQVNAAGGGNYQTMINAALRQHIANRTMPLEKTLRRVIREELRKRGAA